MAQRKYNYNLVLAQYINIHMKVYFFLENDFLTIS